MPRTRTTVSAALREQVKAENAMAAAVTARDEAVKHADLSKLTLPTSC